MSRRVLAVLVFPLLVAVSLSAQTEGIEIRWSPRTIPQLLTQIRYSTIIQLPPGEGVMDIQCGDRDYWVTEIIGNTALVKPSKEGAATNITIYGTTAGSIRSSSRRARPRRTCS